MATKNTTINFNDVFGLPPDIRITDKIQHTHSWEFTIKWNEPKPGERVCPHCGGTHCVVKDSGEWHTVRHTPSAGQAILITYHSPRYQCKNLKCYQSFYVRPDWVLADMSITKHLFFQIYDRLVSSVHAISAISGETRTTPSIVNHVMDHIELDKPSCLPMTLGIDEFFGETGFWDEEKKRYVKEDFHCVLCDGDAGYVYDVLLKATFKEVHDYFMKNYTLYQRNRVRYITTDMRPGFLKVIRACFRQATICIDQFHVIKSLTDVVSEIRVHEQNRYYDALKDLEKGTPEYDSAEEKYKLLKKSQRLLTTSPYNEDRFWNINEGLKNERLHQIFALSPDLKEVYQALQAFYMVANEKQLNLRTVALSEWLKVYCSCEIPALRKAATTIESHRKGIEASWRFGKSNAPTERLNKTIKDIKRLGFGAHNFERFRKRILLACGPVTFVHPTFSIHDEKQSVIDPKGGAR